jgi:hypothetical protein
LVGIRALPIEYRHLTARVMLEAIFKDTENDGGPCSRLERAVVHIQYMADLCRNYA